MSDNPRKKAFILGAGFSKAFDSNMPLTPDLTQAMSDKTKASIVSQGLGFLSDDVEALLSALSGNYPWRDRSEYHGDLGLLDRLLTEIIEFMYKRESLVPIDRREVPLQALFDFVRQNRSDVLTFNYDTIFEKVCSAQFLFQMNEVSTAASHLESLYRLPIAPLEGRIGEKFVSPGREYGPHLMKLHGSINWLTPNMADMDGYLPVFCYFKDTPSYFANDLQPLIVAPTFEKEKSYRTFIFRQIWQDAARALENADEIVFLGYSFPLADTYFKVFFHTAINRANQPKAVAVVNIDQSDEYKLRVGKFLLIEQTNNFRIANPEYHIGDHAIQNYVETCIKPLTKTPT